MTKIRGFYFDTPKSTRDGVFICVVVALVAVTAFFLGRLSVFEGNKESVKVVAGTGQQTSTEATDGGPQVSGVQAVTSKKSDSRNSEDGSGEAQAEPPQLSENAKRLIEYASQPKETPKPQGYVIGVKSSKNYYLPWCGTVARLGEANAVVFNSSVAAKAAGYHPAKNCKGIQ